MVHYCKVLATVAGWLTAVMLMLEGTVEDSLDLQSWSLFVAAASFVPSMWLIHDQTRRHMAQRIDEAMREERARTRRLVLAVATEFANAELPKIHEREREPSSFGS